MSKFEKREIKKRSVVEEISDVQAKPKKEKRDTTPRTFYLHDEHIKALAFEKAKTGKDLSEIVRESLEKYFGEEIEKYK